MPQFTTREEAIAKGAKRYFIGEVCFRGHVDERWVSDDSCRTCRNENARRRRLTHRERYLESERKWRSANPDTYAAAHKRWRRANRAWFKAWNAAHPEVARDWRRANAERLNELSKVRRLANIERFRAYCRKWRAENPEKARAAVAAWAKANPDRYATLVRNRRARKLAAGGTHTVKEIQEILAAQGFKCAYCRKSVRKSKNVDHIKPLARGGTNDRKNLQILCPLCNNRKHAKDPIEFARHIGLLL